MKKLILLLMAGSSSLTAIAQTPAPATFTPDKGLSRWVLDVNMLGGAYNQKMDMANTAPNYLNGININTGNTGFRDGGTIGGDLQLGYFFDKGRHWGIGTGLMYLRQWGTVTLDQFHAEYQSVDDNGFIFRQVVSSGAIEEQVKTHNFNIPLLLKYKHRFSRAWGFTADAGALFNLQMKHAYTTNASFDYEAIYKFVTNEAGESIPVYDQSVVPHNSDFLITRNHFSKNNPQGDVHDYFDAKRAAGYNVGLDVKPDQAKGTTKYAVGSVGFIVRPSINYFFSDKVALNVGGYYLYQSFENEGNENYTMTGKPGAYNSIINSASKVHTQSLGGNLGLRFFLGRSAHAAKPVAPAPPVAVVVTAPPAPAPVVRAEPAAPAEPVLITPVVVREEPDMIQVLFAFNESELSPASRNTIDGVFRQMQEDPESVLVIDGNTDKVGSDEYNQKLSERRASSVKAYLTGKGISGDRIRNKGNGERKPVAPNSTSEGRSRNRRAELQIRIQP